MSWFSAGAMAVSRRVGPGGAGREQVPGDHDPVGVAASERGRCRRRRGARRGVRCVSRSTMAEPTPSRAIRNPSVVVLTRPVPTMRSTRSSTSVPGSRSTSSDPIGTGSMATATSSTRCAHLVAGVVQDGLDGRDVDRLAGSGDVPQVGVAQWLELEVDRRATGGVQIVEQLPCAGPQRRRSGDEEPRCVGRSLDQPPQQAGPALVEPLEVVDDDGGRAGLVERDGRGLVDLEPAEVGVVQVRRRIAAAPRGPRCRCRRR